MRLFVSHASEDKKDFVKPLVEALKQSYEVWFDEFELTIGDSLLGKVSEGLNSCDFGVVVLSPNFFKKKWPKSELDGLFALETSTRKVILPIWKDVSEQDIRRFSPILAGRLAVKASEGVERVIDAIRLAIGAAQRQRELTSLATTGGRLRGLDETLTEERESKELLGSEKGVELIVGAIDTLFAIVQKTLSDIEARSNTLKFQFKRANSLTFRVRSLYSLNLHIMMAGLARNAAFSGNLGLTIFQDTGPLNSELIVIEKQDFQPAFRRSMQVVWKEDKGKRTLSTEETASHAIGLLADEIERHRK